MAYIVTLKVPDKGAISPWYEIFERGCCAGCPNNFYSMDNNKVLCGIMGLDLPEGYDTDVHPWPLCPIESVKKTDDKIPMRAGKLKWLRPDNGDKA